MSYLGAFATNVLSRRAMGGWWERVVFNGGEKIVRDGKDQVQWSAYPNRFLNSLIIAISSTVLAVGMGTFIARLRNASVHHDVGQLPGSRVVQVSLRDPDGKILLIDPPFPLVTFL